jgi:hypothetical protein
MRLEAAFTHLVARIQKLSILGSRKATFMVIAATNKARGDATAAS